MQTIGQYFIEAGTILTLVFGRLVWAQQVGTFLVTVGTALEAGTGTVGPIRIGSEGVTVTVAPWQG
jgi:hypothetical protein